MVLLWQFILSQQQTKHTTTNTQQKHNTDTHNNKLITYDHHELTILLAITYDHHELTILFVITYDHHELIIYDHQIKRLNKYHNLN